MRIIAGKYRGRTVDVPKGLEVRPTTDRVREAMFSSLTSLGVNFEDAIVLDAFAGSGALGFEAVSRGAKKLVSFENNKKNFENLSRNFQMFKEDMADIKLLFSDVKKTNFSYVGNVDGFNLLFFDPPYANKADEVLDILKALIKAQKISNNAMVVYEHASKDSFDAYVELFALESFELVNAKVYNDISVEYLRMV